MDLNTDELAFLHRLETDFLAFLSANKQVLSMTAYLEKVVELIELAPKVSQRFLDYEEQKRLFNDKMVQYVGKSSASCSQAYLLSNEYVRLRRCVSLAKTECPTVLLESIKLEFQALLTNHYLFWRGSGMFHLYNRANGEGRLGLDYARNTPKKLPGFEYEGVFAFPGASGTDVDSSVYTGAISKELSFGLSVLGGGWSDSSGEQSACAFTFANKILSPTMVFYALSIPKDAMGMLRFDMYIPSLPVQYAFWGKFEKFHPRFAYERKGIMIAASDRMNALIRTYAQVLMVPASVTNEGGDVIQDQSDPRVQNIFKNMRKVEDASLLSAKGKRIAEKRKVQLVSF